MWEGEPPGESLPYPHLASVREVCTTQREPRPPSGACLGEGFYPDRHTPCAVPHASVVIHRRLLKKIRNKQLPTPEIAQCLRQLTDAHRSAKGLGMKRLKGIDLPVFEARVNRAIRLVFTTQPATVYREKGGRDQPRMTLVVWDVDHHDDALNRARRIDYDFGQKPDHLSLTALLHADAVQEEEHLSRLPEYPITVVWLLCLWFAHRAGCTPCNSPESAQERLSHPLGDTGDRGFLANTAIYLNHLARGRIPPLSREGHYLRTTYRCFSTRVSPGASVFAGENSSRLVNSRQVYR